MSVDFKTFVEVVGFVTDVRKPVLIRGRHGIGKSEVVYQLAEKVDLPVVERRASQMTEGDLVGLPSTDGNTTTFNPPDWFKECCDEPRVLFLDEIDRATVEVRQGIFELTDSRKLNGHHLHPDTLIFAAINGGNHASQYQVGEMDPAELSRYTVFDLEPTKEDWLVWAKDRVSPVVLDFITQSPAHLEHEGEFEPNKVYPCRRSWKRLNDCLDKAGLLVEWNETLYPLALAFVGMEAAVDFQQYVKDYDRAVTVENIIDEGKVDLTEDFGVNEHTAMVDKIRGSKYVEDELTEDQIQNVAIYFMSLPSEIAVLLWQVITDSGEANTIALHRATVDGESVAARFVKMITAD